MDSAAPTEGDAADRETKPLIHEEIGRLPSDLRDAIVLYYLEGLTVEATAGRLRCPVGTLKSRLGRGRELLRSRLTRRGLATSSLLLMVLSSTEDASAAIPEPLLTSTVHAGLDGGAVSGRVAAMVLEEEALRRRARSVISWSLLIATLLIVASFKLASGRAALAAQPPSNVEESAIPGAAAPGHCLLRR